MGHSPLSFDALHSTWRATGLLVLRGNELGQSSPTSRMLDEQAKPLEPCFFLFCADDPIGRHPLVPGGLRIEEFPSGFVGAKLLLLLTTEPGGLPLFIT